MSDISASFWWPSAKGRKDWSGTTAVETAGALTAGKQEIQRNIGCCRTEIGN